MKPTDIDACKLLCASAAAYAIPESATTHTVSAGDFKCAIKDDPKSCDQFRNIGFVDDIHIVNVGIEGCLVGKTTAEVVVAFRGTIPNSWLDWFEDAMAEPTTNVNLPGKVHSGFLFALMTIADQIKIAIDTLDPTHALPLYITGHSKGGGMAPIAAMYFKSVYNITATNVITFAGPKPGDTTFFKSYNTAFPDALRYENYLDIVPLLPPSDSFIALLEELPLPATIKNLLDKAKTWDYESVGRLVYINNKGEIADVPTPTPIRVAAIIEKMVTLNFTAIEDAHHASCGFRYMHGTCQGSVCGI
ncbi:lipase family protein [Sungkyunkwania multivorans]|uniref:Lipase family protein n=1 Tax=Sungkyunkwania multivorans TaxID=1173618 RepID=A0ABW3CY55_9FLAO